MENDVTLKDKVITGLLVIGLPLTAIALAIRLSFTEPSLLYKQETPLEKSIREKTLLWPDKEENPNIQPMTDLRRWGYLHTYNSENPNKCYLPIVF